MNYRTIPIQISQEYVKGAGVPVGAAGSHDDVLLELEFSPLWDGLTKSITWLDARKENPTITILTADLLAPGTTNVYRVPIPAEPKRLAGNMTMSIKGAAVEGSLETRATLSVSCTFPVLPSDFDEDAEEAGDITATQAQQIQAQVDTIIDTIAGAFQSAADAEVSNQAAQAAKSAAESAAVSANAAMDGAANANADAQIAKSSAQSSAVSAQTSASEAEQSAQWARQFSQHPPKIINGTWWCINEETGEYEDTGLQAKGEKGDTAFAVDENSGRLVRVWYGTVAQYNALVAVDPDVFYYLLEGAP